MEYLKTKQFGSLKCNVYYLPSLLSTLFTMESGTIITTDGTTATMGCSPVGFEDKNKPISVWSSVLAWFDYCLLPSTSRSSKPIL